MCRLVGVCVRVCVHVCVCEYVWPSGSACMRVCVCVSVYVTPFPCFVVFINKECSAPSVCVYVCVHACEHQISVMGPA